MTIVNQQEPLSITLYGIPNCTSVKKARAWLDASGLAYQFHDYKKLSIDALTLKRWCDEFGYEFLINKRGTTWRKLLNSQQQELNEKKAIKLMQSQPSLIKKNKQNEQTQKNKKN